MFVYWVRAQQTTEALVATKKETGLEEHAEVSNYKFMSCEQSAHKIKTKIYNKYFGSMAELKYLGTNVTNPNCSHEEIKSRLNSKNACIIQCWLFCSFYQKNIKIMQNYFSACCFIRVSNLVFHIQGGI